MSPRADAFLHLLVCILCPIALVGQQASVPAASSSPAAVTSSPSLAPSADSAPPTSPPIVHEFPVLMQQSVVAGKTLVGTKVQAKLGVATLVEGRVIPRNAVFSGEVVESAPKTATDVSRLSIRMDSVQWKNGSALIKAYLTGWYYPTTFEEGQNLQYGPTQSQKATWNGQGAYPDPNSRSYKPFPGSDTDKDSSVPDTPSSGISNHRAPMKNVDFSQNDDGTITLASQRSTIKLDKLTTYVLSTGNPLSPK